MEILIFVVTMGDKVRYGIIGIGRWAREVHIPTLNKIDQAEITALSSRSDENLIAGLKIAKGRPKAFKDYYDLLGYPDVDAVIITTPNYTHGEIALQALKNGKHIFCEKPLAITLEECDRIIEAAAKAGRVLQVGLELRYAPLFVRMKDLISQGEIGKPYLMWCNLFRGPLRPGWREDPSLSGGIFLEVACHYLDLFGYLINSRPVSIAASGGRKQGHKDFNHAWVIINYSSGTKACFGLSMLSPYEDEIVIGVIGDKGKIEAKLQGKLLNLWKMDEKEPKTFTFEDGEYGFSGTYRQHLDFINCIQKGGTPLANGKAGRDAVAIGLAVQKALEEDKSGFRILDIGH